MKKNYLHLLTALVVWLTCALGASAADTYDFTAYNLQYVITSSTTAKVVGHVLASPSGSYEIYGTVTNEGTTYRVTEIGEGAFENCDKITRITINENVVTIGENAFSGCSGMTRVTIPNTVTTIGGQAFGNCTSLTEVVIPNSVTYVGGLAFAYCSALTSVDLGENCRFKTSSSWSLNIFKGCTSLTDITCRSIDAWEFHEPMFDESTYTTATLHVPSSALNAYQNTNYWNKFTHVEGFADELGDALNSALNIEGGTINFGSSGDYPWTVVTEGGRTYAQSGNAGVASSASVLTATVILSSPMTLWFDFKAWGEGVTAWDKCEFLVDGVTQFAYGQRQNDWETYSVLLTAGTHTLTWQYTKDSSVNPTGDYFAVDNVCLGSDLSAAVSDGTFTVTSIGAYPWTEVTEGGRTFAQSGNAGVASSTSEMISIVKVDVLSRLSFDFKAWGEGSSTAWDKCEFLIDGVSQFAYGARQNDWETYTMEVTPGTHTLTWRYTKDSSVNPTGDYFAVDNLSIHTLEKRGDVDADGNVNISDVTALIDYLLSGNASGIFLANADCDLDGNVNISDVTTLIDYLLSGNWPGEQEFTVGGVTFKMVPVFGGTFTMGFTGETPDIDDEGALPAHQVTLSSYSIGETEVTQALWVAVMGSNPSYYTGDTSRPVEKVSWNDCQEFITKLNQMTGMTFRLPTEAEWEFAARGGNMSHGYMYAGSNTLGDVAWNSNNNSAKTTQPVGQKSPNELGLYDMSGNVWEWCNDYYDVYSANAQTNPTGPTSGSDRVARGGAFFNNQGSHRVWFRIHSSAGHYADGLGFRLAL
jgi:formylglycine-generating enzyme required for sulfatase activity